MIKLILKDILEYSGTEQEINRLVWRIRGIILTLVVIVLAFMSFGIRKVSGNELAVRETVFGGVSQTVQTPRTYFVNKWAETYYVYNMGVTSFVMNDRQEAEGETASGRDMDSYEVPSSDNQLMKISMAIRWKLDPTMLLNIHQKLKAAKPSDQERFVEETLIRPATMSIVKNRATVVKAIEAYSGAGLVQLQSQIAEDLMSPNGSLAANGVIVDSSVIEEIRLDPEYINTINARQLQAQKELLEKAKTDATLAAAKTMEAEAQGELLRQVVGAKRDSEVAIIRAKQEAEQTVIAAEASAKQKIAAAGAKAKEVEIAAQAEAAQIVTIAKSRQEAAISEALSITALGKAQAEAERLKFSAYEAKGADLWTQIEVSKSMSEAFRNIDGYLPQNMNLTLLSNDFTNAVRSFMSSQQIPSTVANPVK